jgi:hypothetical protein
MSDNNPSAEFFHRLEAAHEQLAETAGVIEGCAPSHDRMLIVRSYRKLMDAISSLTDAALDPGIAIGRKVGTEELREVLAAARRKVFGEARDAHELH